MIGSESPINLNTRSHFVTEMHAANLTVHAQNFKDDQLFDGVTQRTVNVKGVDGMYTDYVSSAVRVFNFLGS